MKSLTLTLLLLSLAAACAQTTAIPVPKAILLQTTNEAARLSVMLLSADSWRQSSAKQLVVTNPKLVCLTADKATARKDGDSVSLILHQVTAYGPFLRKSDPGENLKLQTTPLKKYTYSLRKDDWVQINDELMTSENFWQTHRVSIGTGGSR